MMIFVDGLFVFWKYRLKCNNACLRMRKMHNAERNLFKEFMYSIRSSTVDYNTIKHVYLSTKTRNKHESPENKNQQSLITREV